MSEKISTYDNHSFPYESRLDIPNESTKSIENKNLRFKEWLAKLSLLSKDFCKSFQVFDADFKEIPEVWLNIKAHYNAEEAVEAKEDETGVLSTILKAKITNGMQTLKEWEDMKPKLVSFMIRSMTDAAVKRVEERDREAWLKALRTNDILSLREQVRKSQVESGKATSLKDKQDARDARYNVKLKAGERFEDFVKRIADADYMCEVAGVIIPNDELRYCFLQEMQNYPNVAIHILATQFLQLLVTEHEDSNNPLVVKNPLIKDIPTMIDAFRSTLIVSNRTESQMLSNKFTVNTMNVNEDSSRSSRAPTKFDNGEEGFQIEDNIYDIFQFDNQDRFTGIKRFKVIKNKHGKTEMKPITNTESESFNADKETSANKKKTKSQLAVRKIMKDKDCTYEEARKLFGKCNNCGIDGHHQADCRVKNKEGSDTYNTNENNSRNKVQQDNTNKGSSYFGMITDSSEDGDDRCVYASYYHEEYILRIM